MIDSFKRFNGTLVQGCPCNDAPSRKATINILYQLNYFLSSIRLYLHSLKGADNSVLKLPWRVACNELYKLFAMRILVAECPRFFYVYVVVCFSSWCTSGS